MSWLSSIKEKSLKLAQLYKNELTEFVTNLGEDLKSLEKSEKSTDTSFEQTSDNLQIETLEELREPESPTTNYEALMNVLEPYLAQKPSYDDLQAKVSTILANLDEYINQDPITPMSSQGQSFTNFQEFCEQCELTDNIYEKIVRCEPHLQELFGNIGFNDAQRNEYAKKTIIRFLYSLICLLEVKTLPKGLISPEKKVQEEVGVAKEEIIDTNGDALERKSHSSDQYVVVEDGSSSCNRSNSNETEKIESTSQGQRDVNNESEIDDYDMVDKTLSTDFHN